jgi:hypothetical protein
MDVRDYAGEIEYHQDQDVTRNMARACLWVLAFYALLAAVCGGAWLAVQWIAEAV